MTLANFPSTDQQPITIFDYFHDPFLLLILTVNPVLKKQIMGWLLKERLVAYNRQLPNYSEACRLVIKHPEKFRGSVKDYGKCYRASQTAGQSYQPSEQN